MILRFCLFYPSSPCYLLLFIKLFSRNKLQRKIMTDLKLLRMYSVSVWSGGLGIWIAAPLTGNLILPLVSPDSVTFQNRFFQESNLLSLDNVFLGKAARILWVPPVLSHLLPKLSLQLSILCCTALSLYLWNSHSQHVSSPARCPGLVDLKACTGAAHTGMLWYWLRKGPLRNVPYCHSSLKASYQTLFCTLQE